MLLGTAVVMRIPLGDRRFQSLPIGSAISLRRVLPADLILASVVHRPHPKDRNSGPCCIPYLWNRKKQTTTKKKADPTHPTTRKPPFYRSSHKYRDGQDIKGHVSHPQPPPRRMKGALNYTGTLYLLFQTLVGPSLITQSKYHIQNKTTTVVVFTV